ncbi:MAG: molybdenum cofactor guanylyltransferase [Gammaproteobacteria bacterium]|nr:MAG: molybdenum cofactor guanylyltransferase [Gammaproteobacteria bacterium]
MNSEATSVSCIILAGGRGRRAGGLDKGLLPYEKKTGENKTAKSKPLIEHVIDAVKNQVDDIVISANRNIESYKSYSANVIGDASEDYQGPLAGIAACLKHCKHELVLVVACDMPNLPGNLVTRLLSEIQNNSISIATVDRHHQLALIIKSNMLDSVQQHLKNNQLKLIQWVESVPYDTVSFNDMPAAFVNLNHLN